MGADLERDIEAAFRDQGLPEGGLFVTGDPEGAEELFLLPREEFTVELLARHTAAISFLSDEGFCFLLPALMRVSLQQPDSSIADALIMRLIPPKGDPTRPSYLAWWGRLTVQQKGTVIRFLRQMDAHHDNGLVQAADSLEAGFE